MADHVPDPRDPQHGDVFECVIGGKVTGRCIVREIPAHCELEWLAGSGPNGTVSPYLPKHPGGLTRQTWNEHVAAFLRPKLVDLDPDQAIAELDADLEAL